MAYSLNHEKQLDISSSNLFTKNDRDTKNSNSKQNMISLILTPPKSPLTQLALQMPSFENIKSVKIGRFIGEGRSGRVFNGYVRMVKKDALGNIEFRAAIKVSFFLL